MSSVQTLPEMDDEYLRFLQDEGLDLLAVFRKIRDREKRDLIVELSKALAAAQTDTNGGSC